MTQKTRALYLVKDGEHPKLFHGDDLEAARADGWKEPDFKKSNGADWNAEEEQDARDAAADFAKAADAAKVKDAKADAKPDPKSKK